MLDQINAFRPSHFHVLRQYVYRSLHFVILQYVFENTILTGSVELDQGLQSSLLQISGGTSIATSFLHATDIWRTRFLRTTSNSIRDYDHPFCKSPAEHPSQPPSCNSTDIWRTRFLWAVSNSIRDYDHPFCKLQAVHPSQPPSYLLPLGYYKRRLNTIKFPIAFERSPY
jgi:hypothetical protein